MPTTKITPPQLPTNHHVTKETTPQSKFYIAVKAEDLYFVNLTGGKVISGSEKLAKEIPTFGKPIYKFFGTTAMNSVLLFKKSGALSKVQNPSEHEELQSHTIEELLNSDFSQEKDQLSTLPKTKESIISSSASNKKILQALDDNTKTILTDIIQNISPLIIHVEPKGIKPSTSYGGMYVCDEATIKTIFYKDEEEKVNKYFNHLSLQLKPLSRLS